MRGLGALLIICLIVSILKYAIMGLAVVGIVALLYYIFKGIYKLYINVYKDRYFNSDAFKEIVQSESEKVEDINELNSHTKELKNLLSELGFWAPQYGTAVMEDSSAYNFKRNEWGIFSNDRNVYNCSLQVCKNAQNNPMKYLCKYFNVSVSKKTINKLDEMINIYSALEEGTTALKAQKEDVISELDIPNPIKNHCLAEFEERIGYQPVAIPSIEYPEFIFQYISAGGNSSANCKVHLDIPNLESLENYISDRINYLESAVGQRRLMTRSLREYIKQRDNYTCCNCGISIKDEPHLLLEIDHIKPISKGGLTEESNLQTLCWRCNRKKSAKY